MERSVSSLGGLSGLVGFFLFNFRYSLYTLYHVGMNVSFSNVRLCLLQFQKVGRRRVLFF